MKSDVTLVFNKKALLNKKKSLSKAQDTIDKECVEKMSEFVPVALPKYKNAGALRASVKINEPGEIVYTSPFARHQYYDNLNHKNTGNPKATRLWFQTMKNKYIEEISQKAQKALNGEKL